MSRCPRGHDMPGPASERGEQVGTTPGEKRREKEEKGPTRPRRSPEIRLAGGSVDEAHPCGVGRKLRQKKRRQPKEGKEVRRVE